MTRGSAPSSRAPVVLLADRWIAARRAGLAERLGERATLVTPPDFSEGALVAAAPEADVIVTSLVPSPVLRAAGRLRLLQLWIAGVDHLDLALLRRRNVLVATAHENARAVAELALAHVLACGRGLALGDRKLRQGDWSVGRFKAPEPGSSTYGRRVGIIGFGAIGRAFAELAAGFRFRLAGIKRQPDPDLGARYGLDFLAGPDALPRVLADSDFLLVALPKTPETVDLIGAGELALMKPTAWLILVGRPEVVNEEALYVACRDRRIAGAGVDVWTRTPPPEPCYPGRFPFHELDNIVMTPHCGGWTRQAVDAQAVFVAENLRRFLDGEPLQGLAHLDLGY